MDIRIAGLLAASLASFAAAQPPELVPLRPGAGRGVYAVDTIGRRCPEFSEIKPGPNADDLRDCRVLQSGEVGSVQGRTYYYAIYCLIPNDAAGNSRCGDDTVTAGYYRERGLAIFSRDRSSATATLLLDRAGPDLGLFLFHQKPEIIDHPAGTLLYVPITVDGTGNGNASEYYVWNADEWAPIDSDGWLKDLQRRVPAGLELRKGIWPDLRTMRGETPLYRDGDANCCPTGGTVRITLAIRSRRFVIQSVVFDRA